MSHSPYFTWQREMLQDTGFLMRFIRISSQQRDVLFPVSTESSSFCDSEDKVHSCLGPTVLEQKPGSKHQKEMEKSCSVAVSSSKCPNALFLPPEPVNNTGWRSGGSLTGRLFCPRQSDGGTAELDGVWCPTSRLHPDGDELH